MSEKKIICKNCRYYPDDGILMDAGVCPFFKEGNYLETGANSPTNETYHCIKAEIRIKH